MGWAKFLYEDKITLVEAGDCAHQRPGISHYLFDYSPDMEYLEIVGPADFKSVDVAALARPTWNDCISADSQGPQAPWRQVWLWPWCGWQRPSGALRGVGLWQDAIGVPSRAPVLARPGALVAYRPGNPTKRRRHHDVPGLPGTVGSDVAAARHGQDDRADAAGPGRLAVACARAAPGGRRLQGDGTGRGHPTAARPGASPL